MATKDKVWSFVPKQTLLSTHIPKLKQSFNVPIRIRLNKASSTMNTNILVYRRDRHFTICVNTTFYFCTTFIPFQMLSQNSSPIQWIVYNFEPHFLVYNSVSSAPDNVLSQRQNLHHPPRPSPPPSPSRKSLPLKQRRPRIGGAQYQTAVSGREGIKLMLTNSHFYLAADCSYLQGVIQEIFYRN